MFWRKLAQKIVSQVLASYHTVAALVLQSTQCTRGYHITRTARVVRRKTDTRMHAPMSFLKNKLFEGTTHQHAIDRLPAGKATCERDAQRQSRIRWWSTGMIVPAGKGRGGEGLYRASSLQAALSPRTPVVQEMKRKTSCRVRASTSNTDHYCGPLVLTNTDSPENAGAILQALGSQLTATNGSIFELLSGTLVRPRLFSARCFCVRRLAFSRMYRRMYRTSAPEIYGKTVLAADSRPTIPTFLGRNDAAIPEAAPPES